VAVVAAKPWVLPPLELGSVALVVVEQVLILLNPEMQTPVAVAAAVPMTALTQVKLVALASWS